MVAQASENVDTSPDQIDMLLMTYRPNTSYGMTIEITPMKNIVPQPATVSSSSLAARRNFMQVSS